MGFTNSISVALGGGGTRCVAHIGALMALEDLGYTIDSLSGSSGGAIVAALYARGYSTLELTGIAYELGWTKVPFLKQILTKLFKDHPIVKTHYAVITDLHTKEIVVKNPTVKDVLASCRIIGMPAVDGIFVDGCVANNVPINVLPKPAIGFNVIAKDIDRKIKLSWLQQIGRVVDLSCLQQLLDLRVIDIMPNYVNPFKTSQSLINDWIYQAYRITMAEAPKIPKEQYGLYK